MSVKKNNIYIYIYMRKSKLLLGSVCLYSIGILRWSRLVVKKSIIASGYDEYSKLLEKNINGNFLQAGESYNVLLKKEWFKKYPNIISMKKHLDNKENYLKNNPFFRKEKKDQQEKNYWWNEKDTKQEIRETLLKYRLEYAGSFGGGNEAYFFGTRKADPYKFSANEELNKFLNSWKIEIKTSTSSRNYPFYDEIFKDNEKNIFKELEVRLYRVRCEEAWSMGIKYIGIPFEKFIKFYNPSNTAKYVNLVSPFNKEIYKGQNEGVLPDYKKDKPYETGVKLKEAMHPLAFFVIGILDNNDVAHPIYPPAGGPFGVVFPWKYCFKSLFGIQKIEFLDKRPIGSWERMQRTEYGFYANVNPTVGHRRWSQATERQIPNTLLSPRIPTLMYNGYKKDVENLYEEELNNEEDIFY
jgi:methionine sulfoxide reductase catalytic subunit